MKICATPELLRRSMLSMTKEPIDLLHQFQLINDEELSIAIKLRVLRNSKYGRIGPATNTAIFGIVKDNTRSFNNQDIEKLYNESINILSKYKVTKLVLDICIFNLMPKNFEEVEKLKQAFQLLSKLYSKNIH